MTANHTTYEKAVQSAHVAKAATITASVLSQAGDYGAAQRNLQGGGSHSAYEAAIGLADANNAARIFAAEQAKQAAVDAAKATLIATGETP